MLEVKDRLAWISFTPKPSGHYLWKEAKRSLLDTRLLFFTHRLYSAFIVKAELYDIDPDECVLLSEAMLPHWTRTTFAYVVTDPVAQLDKLSILLAHFTHPEST